MNARDFDRLEASTLIRLRTANYFIALVLQHSIHRCMNEYTV